MKRLNYKKVTSWVGAAVLTSFVSLPLLAQANPRPSILNEPSSQRNSQTPVGQKKVASNLSALDREFMIMAAQGNNAEIQTSQLALQKSEDETVRNYAQQMIQEHTLANEQLSQIASEYGLNLPSDPGPLNAALAQQLTQLSGAEFNRAYMSVQENAHLKTIALYRTAIEQGQAPVVQSYASELLPRITEHYEMASHDASQSSAEKPQRLLK